MLKKILPFLIVPAMLYAANTYTKTYSFSRPEVKNNIVYVRGCKTSVIPFAPSTPSKAINLHLPRGEVAVSFEVTCSDPITLNEEIYIKPFRPGGISSNQPRAEYFTRSSSIYDADAFYPSEVKSPRFFTHFRYGHSIFIASLRPVQYNPVSGKLIYFNKISVHVTTRMKRDALPVYKFSPFIKSQLQLEVDNPEALEGLPYTPRDGDDYDYALITTNALKDSWGDFLDFNKERGLKTKLATIEDINASNKGDHQADKLKNYLKKEYEDHDITFVMLGGDDKISSSNQIESDAITHKSYTCEFKDYGTDYHGDTDIAADMFYETLDGQELEDLEWELYAGRFPADDAAELQRIIDKTIAYSKEPSVAAIKKVIMAGEKAWPNINGGTCYGKDNLELLKGECSKNGFTTKGYDNTYNFTDFYEKETNWSKSQLVSAINSGTHFVNHVGHSNNFMIMKIQDTDIPSLTNTAYYLGYTIGCYCGAWDNRKISVNANFNTGHYSQDCIAEDFICGTDNGPIAFISMTRYGLGDNGIASTDGSDGSSARLWRYLFDGIYDKKMHHLAMAQAYSKWVNKEQILVTDMNTKPYFGQMAYVAYESNMLGDPALSIWSETPEELTADHPTSIQANATRFSWETKNPYTAVALLDKDGNDIICSQITGEDGKCEITNDALSTYLAANIGGTLKINVKAQNFFPYQGDITIDGTSIKNNKDSNFKNYLTFSKNNTRLIYSFPAQEKMAVSIYNSKGAMIKSQEIINQSGEIALSNMSSGIYFLQLRSKTINFRRSFTISK